MNLADGYEAAILAAIKGARPDPDLKVDEWAEQNIVMPKSSPMPGRFRIDRSYPSRRVHQVLSPNHPSKRIVAKVASQMFKTQTALNWIGATIHQRPRNILALLPGDTLVKRFSARVSTMVRNTQVLRERVAPSRSRDSQNTTKAKDFLGDATLYINTALAATNLSEVSAPNIYIDEVDRIYANVDGEGDPVLLAEARATQFDSDCKFFYTSTPLDTLSSKIEKLFQMGTQEHYHVPCPHCGHLHELVIDNFKYRRDPDTGYMDKAWFVCPDCGAEIEEHHKANMLVDEADGGQARWVAYSKGDGETISFTCPAFYFRVGAINWLALARQYAYAKERQRLGDHDAMQAFYNTRLGLSYSNDEVTTTAKELRERAEAYALRTLPDKALVVTLSVDTQRHRLEVQIEAWGPDLEHWVIDYEKISGDPSVPFGNPTSPWNRLDEIRRTPLMHASGVPIYISAYGIDSGGSNTQDVYNYGAARKGMNCTVLHGANRPNRPIISSTPSRVDIDWGGHKIPQGCELWSVGTDVAKDYLSNRMHLPTGPGAMHFSNALEPEWFDGMVTEQRKVRHIRGRSISEWLNPPGARNEPWDLSVYNLALAYQLGLQKWTALDWKRLRDKLIPLDLPLFAPALVQTPAQAPIPTAATPSAPPPATNPAPPPVLLPIPDPQATTARRQYSRGVQ